MAEGRKADAYLKEVHRTKSIAQFLNAISQLHSDPGARYDLSAHTPDLLCPQQHHGARHVPEQEGAPLMLNMWGINIYTGGHYDNYIVNYYDYREGPAPPGTFDKPAICPDKPEPEDAQTPHHKQAGIHAQIRRMLPNRHQGETPGMPEEVNGKPALCCCLQASGHSRPAR